eukprot:1155839-Pelagomonas_calceolata.AAC.26
MARSSCSSSLSSKMPCALSQGLQARPAAPPCYPKCSAQHSYMGGLPGFCTRQGLQPPCPLASVRGCRKGHSVV